MTELIAWEHQDKTFVGTPQDLVDALTYSNYAYNRQRSPEITPQQWEKVFGQKTMMMEARYQQAQAHG